MTFKKILPTLLVTAALCGCSALDYLGGKKEAPPLPGERVAVLDYERDLRPDENVTAASFTASDTWQNDSWPQAGGNPDHAMQNLALPAKLKKVWSSSIGQGSRKKIPLTTQPIIVGKTIFTLDTDSNVSAFSTEDGKRRWSTGIRQADEDDAVISGGISFDNGTVYATGGYDEVLALDAQSGQIKWRVPLTSPSRAAPTIMNGHVYVTMLNNTIVAMNAADGAVLWEFSGLGQNTGLVGAASPAATSDMVIPAFSSGELYALRTTNGSVAWSDNLSNSVRLGGVTGLSDIRGLPVVDKDIVYAISFGGKMVAVDIRTGSRIWQKDISGAKTPWVSGNRIFVLSTDSQIVSLNKENGAVVWVSQLAKFEDKEKRTGQILWTGPIMAGGRLIAFSSDGRIAEINPEQGTLANQWSSGEDVRISPIVAGNTLYILSEDGDLAAYR